MLLDERTDKRRGKWYAETGILAAAIRVGTREAQSANTPEAPNNPEYWRDRISANNLLVTPEEVAAAYTTAGAKMREDWELETTRTITTSKPNNPNGEPDKETTSVPYTPPRWGMDPYSRGIPCDRRAGEYDRSELRNAEARASEDAREFDHAPGEGPNRVTALAAATPYYSGDGSGTPIETRDEDGNSKTILTKTGWATVEFVPDIITEAEQQDREEAKARNNERIIRAVMTQLIESCANSAEPNQDDAIRGTMEALIQDCINQGGEHDEDEIRAAMERLIEGCASPTTPHPQHDTEDGEPGATTLRTIGAPTPQRLGAKQCSINDCELMATLEAHRLGTIEIALVMHTDSMTCFSTIEACDGMTSEKTILRSTTNKALTRRLDNVRRVRREYLRNRMNAEKVALFAAIDAHDGGEEPDALVFPPPADLPVQEAKTWRWDNIHAKLMDTFFDPACWQTSHQKKGEPPFPTKMGKEANDTADTTAKQLGKGGDPECHIEFMMGGYPHQTATLNGQICSDTRRFVRCMYANTAERLWRRRKTHGSTARLPGNSSVSLSLTLNPAKRAPEGEAITEQRRPPPPFMVKHIWGIGNSQSQINYKDATRREALEAVMGPGNTPQCILCTHPNQKKRGHRGTLRHAFVHCTHAPLALVRDKFYRICERSLAKNVLSMVRPENLEKALDQIWNKTTKLDPLRKKLSEDVHTKKQWGIWARRRKKMKGHASFPILTSLRWLVQDEEANFAEIKIELDGSTETPWSVGYRGFIPRGLEGAIRSAVTEFSEDDLNGQIPIPKGGEKNLTKGQRIQAAVRKSINEIRGAIPTFITEMQRTNMKELHLKYPEMDGGATWWTQDDPELVQANNGGPQPDPKEPNPDKEDADTENDENSEEDMDAEGESSPEDMGSEGESSSERSSESDTPGESDRYDESESGEESKAASSSKARPNDKTTPPNATHSNTTHTNPPKPKSKRQNRQDKLTDTCTGLLCRQSGQPSTSKAKFTAVGRRVKAQPCQKCKREQAKRDATAYLTKHNKSKDAALEKASEAQPPMDLDDIYDAIYSKLTQGNHTKPIENAIKRALAKELRAKKTGYRTSTRNTHYPKASQSHAHIPCKCEDGDRRWDKCEGGGGWTTTAGGEGFTCTNCGHLIATTPVPNDNPCCGYKFGKCAAGAEGTPPIECSFCPATYHIRCIADEAARSTAEKSEDNEEWACKDCIDQFMNYHYKEERENEVNDQRKCRATLAKLRSAAIQATAHLGAPTQEERGIIGMGTVVAITNNDAAAETRLGTVTDIGTADGPQAGKLQVTLEPDDYSVWVTNADMRPATREERRAKSRRARYKLTPAQTRRVKLAAERIVNAHKDLETEDAPDDAMRAALEHAWPNATDLSKEIDPDAQRLFGPWFTINAAARRPMLESGPYGTTDIMHMYMRTLTWTATHPNFWSPASEKRDSHMLAAALTDDRSRNTSKTQLADETMDALLDHKVASWPVHPGGGHYYLLNLVADPGEAPGTYELNVHSYQDTLEGYTKSRPESSPLAARDALEQFLRTHTTKKRAECLVPSTKRIPPNTTTFTQIGPICCFATLHHMYLHAHNLTKEGPQIAKEMNLSSETGQEALRWAMGARVAAATKKGKLQLEERRAAQAAAAAVAAADDDGAGGAGAGTETRELDFGEEGIMDEEEAEGGAAAASEGAPEKRAREEAPPRSDAEIEAEKVRLRTWARSHAKRQKRQKAAAAKAAKNKRDEAQQSGNTAERKLARKANKIVKARGEMHDD